MQEALIVLAAWLVFGGSHLLLSSSGARNTLDARHGPKAFLVLFAAVTLITMVVLIVAITRLGDQGLSTTQFVQQLGLSDGVGNAPKLVLRWTAIVVAGLGALLAIAGLVIYPNSPIAKLSERRRSDIGDMAPLTPTLNRVDAITRHPFFIGVSMLAFAHLALVPTLATAAFFVGLAAVSLIGIPLQDRKLRNRWPADYAPYADQTSSIPFGASPNSRPDSKPSSSPDSSRDSTPSWKPWLWALGITAVFVGLLHPVLAWGSGAGFAILILLFGLAGVIGGLVRSR